MPAAFCSALRFAGIPRLFSAKEKRGSRRAFRVFVMFVNPMTA